MRSTISLVNIESLISHLPHRKDVTGMKLDDRMIELIAVGASITASCSVVLGRFLKFEDEVYLARATELAVPVLRRALASEHRHHFLHTAGGLDRFALDEALARLGVRAKVPQRELDTSAVDVIVCPHAPTVGSDYRFNDGQA